MSASDRASGAGSSAVGEGMTRLATNGRYDPRTRLRLLIAAGGGWLGLRWGGNLAQVLVAQGVALAAFGLINAAAVAGGAWFSGASSASWWPPAAVPVGVPK